LRWRRCLWRHSPQHLHALSTVSSGEMCSSTCCSSITATQAIVPSRSNRPRIPRHHAIHSRTSR
jgi:hypothetical protein